MVVSRTLRGPHRRTVAGGAGILRQWVLTFAVVVMCALSFTAPAAAQTTDLDGAWRADRYELASGGSHDLAGHILFVEGEWNVLFYVLDREGEPVRFSAEGGTFTRSGEELVFTHLYYAAEGDAVEGLEAHELRVDVRDEPLVEPSRASVEGDELTLFFPSGNRMVFRRAGR